MFLISATGIVNVLCDKGSKYVCVYLMYAYVCVFGPFFCLLAVSWNGRGLLLSGLIRGSRLYPSLIILLRANIPSVCWVFFLPFPPSFFYFFTHCQSLLSPDLEEVFATSQTVCSLPPPSSSCPYFFIFSCQSPY